MPSEHAEHWALDPAITFLNHGSFGACPQPVLEAQRRWRDRLERIGAAWYTGNLHKWVSAPKGSAFLHARRDRGPGIRPSTISHGANADLIGATRFRAEFDWQGDARPDRVTRRQRCTPVRRITRRRWLARGDASESGPDLESATAVAAVLGLPADNPAPDAMLGSIVALPLPTSGPLAAASAGASPLDTDPLQQRLVDQHRIGVPIYQWPVPAAASPDAARRLIRISSALHNGPDDVDRLEIALRAIAAEASGASAGRWPEIPRVAACRLPIEYPRLDGWRIGEPPPFVDALTARWAG